MKVEVKLTLPDFVDGQRFDVEADQVFDVIKQVVVHPKFLEGELSDFCTYARFAVAGESREISFLNGYYHSSHLQEAWHKVDRKFGVRIFIKPEKETLGRKWRTAYYRVWMVITSSDHYETIKALGESEDLQAFVPEKWMPKYLLALIQEAAQVQLEIEKWLEGNS